MTLRLQKFFATLSATCFSRPKKSARRQHRRRFTSFGQAAEVLEHRRLLATLVVNDDGGADHTTIQAAIDAAVAGDTILINGGADRIHTEQGITVNKDLTIQGDASGSQVIVQAAAMPGIAINRVFDITSAAVTIDDLTIRHGNVSGSGGAIRTDSPLTVRNSLITENFATVDGGAIYSESADLSVSNSTISQNTTHQEGGGIYSRDGLLQVSESEISQNSAGERGGGIYHSGRRSGPPMTAIIESTSFRGNSAAAGGAMDMNSRAMAISDCTFFDNTATSTGGGILFSTGFLSTGLTIHQSTFTRNTAHTGGGISGGSGILTVTNSTFVENTANTEGGGLRNSRGNWIIRDSTIARNAADVGGGVFLNSDGFTSFGNLELTGSLVTGNSAVNDGGGLHVETGRLRLLNSTVTQNSAGRDGGALSAFRPLPRIVISNSTITQNRADTDGNGGLGGGLATTSVTVHSSIIAGNLQGPGDTPSDIAQPGFGPNRTLAGTNNLIGDPNSAGGLTHGIDDNIVGDGMGGVIDLSAVLETTLRDNGGPTLTHALVPGSPAIEAGSNPENLAFDQRGPGFNRTAGLQSDIGAFEFPAFVVDDDGNGDFLTVQAAIDSASAGGLILVTGGADRAHTEAEIIVDRDVTIQGVPGATQVIVQAAHTLGTATDPVFFVSEVATADFNDLTIRHGFTGIFNRGSLNIGDSRIAHNFAPPTRGAGISSRGPLKVFNSSISDNQGVGVSGLRTSGSLTSVEIIDSEVSRNQSIGIEFNGFELRVVNSRIQQNRTGIAVSTSDAEITNTLISKNERDGFRPAGSSFRVSNSTIADNGGAGVFPSLSFNGGSIVNTTISRNSFGVVIRNTSVGIHNSTITGNGAGIIEVDPLGIATNTVLLTSSIVAGNSDEAGPQDIRLASLPLIASHNLIGDANTSGGIADGVDGNIVGNNGIGTIDVNTVLDTTLRDNGGPTLTHALVAGSPAIDAGSNPLELEFDQRGPDFPRVINGRADIGAVEFTIAPRLAFGTGGNRLAEVVVLDDAFAELFRLTPYPGFLGGVRVAMADVNGDGVNDVITSPGPGGGPHVKVFDGGTREEIAQFMAYDPLFFGGVFVAAADFDGDGSAEIVTSPDAGGGPHVRVFNLTNDSMPFDFFAYDAGFFGGVRVAAGDVNNDGTPDIITGAGPGGGPHVRIFDGTDPSAARNGRDIDSFFAFPADFTGGIFVAANNTARSSNAALAVTTGRPFLTGARVAVFGRPEGDAVFDLPTSTGARVAMLDINQDGINDYLFGSGPGGDGLVQLIAGGDGTPPFGPTIFSDHPFGDLFTGGIFVAGSR